MWEPRKTSYGRSHVVGTNVYVAGDFTNVEGVWVPVRIACLDRQTSTWQASVADYQGEYVA